MNKNFVIAATLLISMATYATASTAHAVGGGQQVNSQHSEMADGEVRKLDLDNSKITLKHGFIKSLDMPAMTMVFNVKDKAPFETIKVGDKVKFLVVNENGKMLITKIEMAQ